MQRRTKALSFMLKVAVSVSRLFPVPLRCLVDVLVSLLLL